LALMVVTEQVDGEGMTCLEDGGAAVTRRGRPFVVGSVLATLMTTIFLLWIVLGIDGSRVTDGVDDLGELLAAVIAAVACGVAARRASAGRPSWALLAGSSFAWAVGEALWSYYDLIKGIQVPFPSLADAGFLTAIPLACIGLLLFPSSQQRTVHRLQGLLDGCIIAMSLLFASWATILGPLYRSHQGGVLKQAISLAYPMSDVVMVSLVIILIARTGRRGWMSLGLVMMGLVAFALADSSFSYLTEVNSYGRGNFLDTGWVAGYLLIGLGALWAITSSSPSIEQTEKSTMSMVAPYAPVLVVLAVTSIQLLRGRHIEPVSWIMAFALVLLVLGRELLRLWGQASDARLRARSVHATDGMPPSPWGGELS
jgi:hypothetical protein